VLLEVILRRPPWSICIFVVSLAACRSLSGLVGAGKAMFLEFVLPVPKVVVFGHVLSRAAHPATLHTRIICAVSLAGLQR